MIEFHCRSARPADRVFILDSWISSYRTSYAAGPIPMDEYHGIMWPIFERLLARPGVITLVAEPPDKPGFLYGFIAAENGDRGPIVHYIYTKSSFRKEGVARGLINAAKIDPRRPFIYTHKTALAARLVGGLQGAKFNPLESRFYDSPAPAQEHHERQDP